MYNKSDVILEVKNISKEFKTSKNKIIKACDNINFKVLRGKTVGIVGESGCGKSTLARILIQLEEASYGEIIYDGNNILLFSEKKKRDNRKKIQMIFQDSLYSFNPKMKVIDILTEPLLNFKIINKKEKEEKAIKLLEMVELSSEILYRYPHNLSGGQRQRIGIARALSLEPEILICDESTSALDVSVQNKIIKLLVKLQKEKNISIIFICHDIALIKSFSHEIIVMYLGNIVEKIPSSKINTNSKHPYTNMLLESVFLLDIENSKNIDSNENEVVNISYSEEGCVFKNRCKYCKDICKIEKPKLKEVEENHKVACHLF